MSKHHTFTQPRISDDRLLIASFADKPIWARHFAEHVKAWERFVSEECWRRYHSKHAFRRAFDQRRACIDMAANAAIDAAALRGRTYMHEAASVRAQMGEGQA